MAAEWTSLLGPALVAAFLVLAGLSKLFSRVRPHLPTDVRVRLGDLDVDDPRTQEELDAAYALDKIDLGEYERRVEIYQDQETEKLMRVARGISGIADKRAYSLVKDGGFRSLGEVDDATVEEIAARAPGIGEKYARALKEAAAASSHSSTVSVRTLCPDETENS